MANVTTATTPGLITRQRQNLGRTRSRGVDLDASVRLAGGLTATLSYEWDDAGVRSFPADATLVGLRLPQVPRQQLAFQARYARPRFSLAVQGRAAGTQFDDDQNLLPLRPFFTLDARAAWSLARPVEAFVAVENLTGGRYEVSRTPVTTLGPPRLVRAGLRLQLGAR